MVELSDEEKLGIEIAGRIKYNKEDKLRAFSCRDCTDEMRENRNCKGVYRNEDEEIPVFFDEDLGTFYSCPVSFIPDHILEFFDRLFYYEIFEGTAPSYEDRNLRFWEATKYLEKVKIESLKKQSETESGEESRLSRLRGMIKRNKG